MKVYENGASLIFEGVCDFDILQILESGQFFRYRDSANGGYVLNVQDRCFGVRQDGKTLTFEGCGLADIAFLTKFFDLERDYGAIKRSYLELNDENIKKAMDFGHGIRILDQNFFEMLITFIISQNNNIPRIKGIVERLCENFGEKKTGVYGDYYAFPKPNVLAGLEPCDLDPVRCGFRAQYVINGAKAFANGDLDGISALPYEDAKRKLMQIKGVGEKVANCVLLFGDRRLSAFPVDVWIKRTVLALYGENFSPDIFKDTAGIAQQYLFYYARKNKIA